MAKLNQLVCKRPDWQIRYFLNIYESEEVLKDMKHFIATHTCFSEEARRAFIENTKTLTHKEMIEGTQTEKAKMVAHWMGKDEFFFCHWLADSEEAIHEALEAQGLADIIVTNANEMVRFVSASDLKDDPVGDPDDVLN